MIVKEEFLSRLRKIFGLNLYEVKIWTSLLSRGVSTAGELSDISNVPRSRTYDILESLEKKGFIVMKLGKPVKFIALKPVEVVERVKKNLMVEASEKSKRLDRVKSSDVLSELTSLHKTGIKYVQPSDLSGALRGRQNLHNHLDMMVRGAEQTITIVTSAEGLNRKFEALAPSLAKAKKRGVKVRVATHLNATNLKIAKELSRVAEIRSMKNIHARFVIIDGKELMFMVLNDNDVHPSYDIGVWVNTEFFATALEQIFEFAWTKMKPMGKIKVTKTVKKKTRKKR